MGASVDLIIPLIGEAVWDILDIGCALGDFTCQIRQLNPRNSVIGIDVAENAIRKARHLHQDILFQVGSLPSLHLESERFDLVTALEVIYYLGSVDRERAVKEVYRILKPGGYFLFSSVLDNGLR
jgi:ubiquinone/menaquinone biosynthesis C-methylase UbiE